MMQLSCHWLQQHFDRLVVHIIPGRDPRHIFVGSLQGPFPWREKEVSLSIHGFGRLGILKIYYPKNKQLKWSRITLNSLTGSHTIPTQPLMLLPDPSDPYSCPTDSWPQVDILYEIALVQISISQNCIFC